MAIHEFYGFVVCIGPTHEMPDLRPKPCQVPALAPEPLWPQGLVVKVLCPNALGGKACGLKAVTKETY